MNDCGAAQALSADAKDEKCYMVPGWRIKLAAPAMEYFVASLRHMVLLKGLIAGAAAAVAVAVQRRISRT